MENVYSTKLMNNKRYYFLNDKKIAKRNVPKEFLDSKNTGNNNVLRDYPIKEYTYIESHGRKLYYLDGKKIAKKNIPKHELDRAINLNSVFEQSEKNLSTEIRETDEKNERMIEDLKMEAEENERIIEEYVEG